MIRALLLMAVLLAASPAWAISDPAEALSDPALEQKAVSIGRGLRCLVCQNESIEDSGSDLARDLRKIVRAQVAAGANEQQVDAWLVARYGDFVRLSPPFNAGTALLWGSPFLALLIGGVVLFAMRRNPGAPPLPLNAAEQRRLSGLMEP